MGLQDSAISRELSLALRHSPLSYGLELDESGWADIEQLISALRQKGGGWGAIDRDRLVQIVVSAPKRRHEIDGGRIRALYGHSIPVSVSRKSVAPPDILFHGTVPENLASILLRGILPMGRQYVHLASDRDVARQVGRRKTSAPMIIVIDAAAANSEGVEFFEAGDSTWLARGISPRFIATAD
ncbi:RNA 2'-phosphotransferase [Arthrobacter sp. RAF14]|uniref:RNA 2'-phosphotransferase n=1 Tax=Arthrobacter sp. RAF14 TaxID=3233051 RepID=UPI003F8DD8AB